jgi:cation-transporting ATPase 13A1
MQVAAFSISWAIPTRRLSQERPFPGQFNSYLLTSVLLQFSIHFFFLYKTHQLVFANGFRLDRFNFRAKFSPSLLNTALFMLKGEMEIVTIVCNYRGNPFMQSFSENKTLLIGIIGSAGIIVVLLADLHPSIAKLFQLVAFPSRAFQGTLAVYCGLDATLSITVEKLSLWFFSRKQRKAAEGLVSPEIVSDLDEYLPNDDDILPESSHVFGLMELTKQMVMMQKTIRDRSNENKAKERKKREDTRKAEEEAQKYLATGRKT